MKYKTELHCHSSPVSRCASSGPDKVVEEYLAAGYTTIVLTNHLSSATFDIVSGSHKDKIAYYMDGYTKLKTAAAGRINILLGCEINLTTSSNDYLVYGITERFLLDNPDILSLNIQKLSTLCRREGLPIYQAHPFRRNMTIVKPSLIDGIEVDNGNIRHNSSNPIALAWADRFTLQKITGSDYHDPGDLTVCGIETEKPITTNDELLAVLKSGSYEILHSGLE